MNMFSRFMNDESGATAIEYGLIAAIIAVGIITTLKQVGTSLNNTFSNVHNQLESANGAAPAGGGGGN